MGHVFAPKWVTCAVRQQPGNRRTFAILAWCANDVLAPTSAATRCDVTKCTGAFRLPSSTGRAAIGSTHLRRRTTAARATEGRSVAPS